MQPKPEDTSIKLPLTFDYKGGQRSLSKGNIVIAVVLLLLTVVVSILLLRGNASLITKLIREVIVWVVVTTFIRFALLGESAYSDAYESLKQCDGMPDLTTFWGIYDIDSEYPYICHFKDGKVGIYVRFEKNVTVGKGEDIVFKHYEGISDAYNLAGSSAINMFHIDYMDNVGNDPRLRTLMENLSECTNPDMKEAMQAIYANLQEDMADCYSSFDVYLFTTSAKRRADQFWNDVYQIIGKFMSANYISYVVLDSEGIRTTCIALNNLYDFSAVNACESINPKGNRRDITAIAVYHGDGSSTKLNKTQEERQADLQRQIKEEEERRQNKKLANRIKNIKAKKQEQVNNTSTVDLQKNTPEEQEETEELVDEPAVKIAGTLVTKIDKTAERIAQTGVSERTDDEDDFDMFDD